MSTMAWSSLRQGIGYQGLLLSVTVAIAATLLVAADRLTRDPIALRHAEDLNASLAQVIPRAIHDNDLLANTLTLTSAAGEPLTVYRALAGGRVTGVAFPVRGFGYSGAIDLMLALDSDGKILGVRVLAHKETPGLGDKIEIAKADWILAFDGRALGDPPEARWGVKKDGGDFDQFSGATITPRAVVRAVKGGLELFAAHRAELTAPGAPPSANAEH